MTICAFGQQLRHSPPCNAERRVRHGPFDAGAERPRCVTAAQSRTLRQQSHRTDDAQRSELATDRHVRRRLWLPAQGVGESGQVPQQPQPWEIVLDAFAELIIITEQKSADWRCTSSSMRPYRRYHPCAASNARSQNRSRRTSCATIGSAPT
jgi:hypothetical protein